MHLQVKTAVIRKGQYGNEINIPKVGIYDDSGKRIKRVKLTDKIAYYLTREGIKVEPDDIEELLE